MTVAVLKIGGELVNEPAGLFALLRDAAALVRGGWKVAICHGGGPQASALQERLGVADAEGRWSSDHRRGDLAGDEAGARG